MAYPCSPDPLELFEENVGIRDGSVCHLDESLPVDDLLYAVLRHVREDRFPGAAA